jgi:hypothetical protein
MVGDAGDGFGSMQQFLVIISFIKLILLKIRMRKVKF